jgi:hypothetical protein
VEMRSIWWFVGLMLLAMGCVVLGAGLYGYITAAPQHTVLAHLHPALWWGVIMVVGGGIFVIVGRRKGTHA